MRFVPALVFACLPANLVAHPHIFIDAGVELILDEKAQLTHIRVTWSYDEFYSLLMIQDLEIDKNKDGRLDSQEMKALVGFDMQWAGGFDGDLEVKSAGQPVTLSGPTEPTAVFDGTGKITTTHLRAVTGAAIATGDLSVKVYDPTYFSAYDITLPVQVTGSADCLVERFEPDIDGKLAQMQDFLKTLDVNADLEENDIPLMGGEFATEIKLSCPAF